MTVSKARTTVRGWENLACVVDERVLVVWDEQQHEKEQRGENQYSEKQHRFGCLGTCIKRIVGQRRKETDDDYANCIGELTLQIRRGRGENDSTTMVTFHLPVNTGRGHKDMYIVLPAHNLSLCMETVNGDAIPDDTRNHLPRASSYTYIHLALNQAKPLAVMPNPCRRGGHVGKRVTGSARKMMMNLKSLCGATSWDVFLASDASKDQINDLRQLLTTGATQPTIDENAVYSNGEHVALNKWDVYPYHSDPNPQPVMPDHPPPGYGEMVNPPPDIPHQIEIFEIGWKGGYSKRSLSQSTNERESKLRRKYRRPATVSPAVSQPAASKQAPSPTQPMSTQEVHQLADLAKAAPPASPSPSQDELLSSNSSESSALSFLSPKPRYSLHSLTLPTICHTFSITPTLYYDFVYFLLYALHRDANALTTCAADWHTMAMCVMRNDEEGLHKTKHACFRQLGRHNVDREENSKGDVPGVLLRWLHPICPRAYTFVDEQFFRMQEAFINFETGKAKTAMIKGKLEAKGMLEVRRAEFCAAALRFSVTCGAPRRVELVCDNCVGKLMEAWKGFCRW